MSESAIPTGYRIKFVAIHSDCDGNVYRASPALKHRNAQIWANELIKNGIPARVKPVLGKKRFKKKVDTRARARHLIRTN